MALTAKKQNVRTLVAFNRMFTPVVRQALDWVKKQGPVHFVLGEFFKKELGNEPYYGTKSWILSDMIHILATIEFMGGKRKTLHVVKRSIESEIINSHHILIEYDNMIGAIHSNYTSGARYERFEIHGKGVSAYIMTPDEAILYADNKEAGRLSGPEIVGSAERPMTYGFYQESVHFCECIASDNETDFNFEKAIDLMKLIDRIHKHR